MGKTLLNIIQDCARELSIPVPLVVMTNNTNDIQRLLALGVAACDELADEKDWQALQRAYSFTTTPGVDLYELPPDYLRAIKRTFWTTRNTRPLNGSTNAANWSTLNNGYGATSSTRFRLVGNKIQVFPMPTAPETLSFEYISIAYVWDGTIQNFKQVFTADSDVPAYHARCLTNFIIYKWKATTGFPTQDALENFNESLKSAKAADKPGNVVSMIGPVGMPLLGVANMPEEGQV